MEKPATQKTILLVGATGLVGQSVLAQALGNPQVGKVVALTRKPITPHPKLLNQLIDFNAIPEEAPWWQADAVICTLGTTIKAAKTAEQFRFVDYTLVAQFAALAAQHAVPCFVLNSAMMANPKAKGLYLRTKGETEEGLAALGFASLTLVRPSLLDGGPRPDTRPGEAMGLWVFRLARPLIPARYRAVRTEAVARALLQAVRQAKPGRSWVENAEITRS